MTTPMPDRPRSFWARRQAHELTPAGLLTTIPLVLGFIPNTHLVAISFSDGQMRTTVPIDLPAPGTDADYGLAVHDVLPRLCPRGVTDVALIGYGAHAPVTTAVAILTAALHQLAIPVSETLCADAGRWWHLTCATPDCCPTFGTPFDTTAITTVLAGIGTPIAPDRQTLIDRIAPVTGPQQRIIAYATAAALARTHALARSAQQAHTLGAERTAADVLLHQGVTTLGHATVEYQAGRSPHDHLAADLTVLLLQGSVRNAAAGNLSGSAWELAMWTDLLRRAEPAYASVPATLLALTALLRREVGLAAVACDRALAVEPDDPVAQALRAGIDRAYGGHVASQMIAACRAAANA